jgi:cytidylate kinase
MSYSIAVDGPAGAGKSTIAKKIAADLKFIYVDTGAMYRAMAIYFLDNEVNPDDEEAIKNACQNVSIRIEYLDGVQQVFLNDENVTGRLRTEQVGKVASVTSVYKDVRTKLVELQRQLAKTTDVIMDGRDIGTCVLPDATLKVYLTASVEARAKRRYDELREKGENPDYDTIAQDIKDRDYRDMNRENSPLRQAQDAVYVDSSDMNIEEVTQRIIELFEKSRREI